MIFVWRGWGLLAAIVTALPIASCGGLIDWNPMVAALCTGVTLCAGGLVCRYCGLKWNQGSGFHTMYWLPLEIWGWIYIVLGGLIGLLSTIALVKHAIVK